jgi:hypothetical protein
MSTIDKIDSLLEAKKPLKGKVVDLAKKFKKGDIVKRKDGKPFLDTGSHELNPAYRLKVRDVEEGKIWIEYSIGWINPEKLIKTK